MKERILISVLISVLFIGRAFAQVGIGIEIPEASLDINVKTQFSDLPDARTKLREYNRVLYADKEGNIGYRSLKGSVFYYRNSYFKTMNSPISVGNGLADLGLSISIIIPPYAKQLVELNYSVGVMNGSAGNASIFLTRTGGLGEEFFYDATRTFSFVSLYASGADARGRAISNSYYDEVLNETSRSILVTYKVLGKTSRNTARFGMWQAVGTYPNFNWGRGSFNINVFDYD